MKPSAFKHLFQLLYPYRFHVFLSFFLTLFPAYFAVWNPFLIGKLIDDGLVARDQNQLIIYASLVLACRIFLFFSNALVNYCLSAFGLQILVDYRDQLLKKILSYPISFFDRMSSGQLTTRLTNDINSLQELFATALVPLIGNAFLILGVIIGMFVINWKLAIISILVVPLLFWITAVFNPRIRRRFGVMRQALSNLNSFSAESLSGSRDIQVFSAQESNLKEFETLSKKLQVKFVHAVREYAFYNPIVPFINSLMDVLIIAVGGWMVFHGQMSVGEVVAFLTYASNFNGPVREISEKFTVFQQAMASVDRLMEISNFESEPDAGNKVAPDFSRIEFQNIEFSYAGSKTPAVTHLNIKINKGEKIALLGETGSGKTTTCSLLMRFYEPSSGKILIDDLNLSEISLDSWRAQIGWVSQDVTLFSTTLRENLSFFDSSISDEEIWNALEFVQLKKWAERLPFQLDEMFSERGSTLSSGQRQLISLARAIIRKPKLIIFDEATAYIDSHTEWLLQEAIDRLWSQEDFKDTTSLFIAHRLSTLRKCDRMFVFRNGKIVETGNLNELMNLKGYAAKLYEEQFRIQA
ncbi:MAG: ABC transporter ATP-binding protein [Deltaproteobacteria bacterium]|nr:ABC transporter ATP-binding protein [Deltaproteobacteria bacterium]